MMINKKIEFFVNIGAKRMDDTSKEALYHLKTTIIKRRFVHRNSTVYVEGNNGLRVGKRCFLHAASTI